MTTGFEAERLDGKKVGLMPVIFQSVTAVAPAAGIATGLPLSAGYAGGALVLAVLLSAVACSFVAVAISQLAKHLPSAGGLYTYTARGLGNGPGFLVGWALTLAYSCAPVYFWGYVGIISVEELQKALPAAPHWLWVAFTISAGLIVWNLLRKGITLSTRAGIIMGLFEIAVFVIVAVVLIIKAGGGNTGSVFDPHFGNPKGFSSVIPAAIYAILAFMGFEAAAPIGEESTNPRRNIPIAMLLSVGIGTVMYLLCSYASVVFIGPAKMLNFPSLGGGSPWIYLGRQAWIPIGVVIFFVLLNSIIANINAGSNAATRMAFSLGRARALPGIFATVHEPSGTPIVAVRVLMIGSLSIALILGLTLGGGPLAVLAAFATTIVVLGVCCYLLVAISCTVFYLREKRDEFNPLLHLVVPLLAVLTISPVLLAALGIKFAGLDIAPLTGPAIWGLWLALAWLALGVAYAAILTKIRPGSMTAMSHIFTNSGSTPTPASPAGTLLAAERGGTNGSRAGLLDTDTTSS